VIVQVDQKKIFMVKRAKHFVVGELFCANEVETIGVFSFSDQSIDTN
jgi:hypothetical protein